MHALNINIIIQARMNSSRLPGKALLKIGGKTILRRLIERLAGSVHKNIIVSTSNNPADKKIIEEAKKNNIRCFTGDELDCLDRFIRTAERYKTDVIVRVTGDNPFTDCCHMDRAITHLVKNRLDYTGIKKLPVGAASEAVTLNALKKTRQLTSDPLHREHITSFIYQNPDIFKVDFIPPSHKSLGRPDLRLTLDTKKDFELINKIYEHLGDSPSLYKIIDLLDSNKELSSV